MIALRTLRRLVAPVAVLGAAAVIAAGCGGDSGGSVSSGAVAVVNGEEITQADFDEVLAQVESKYKASKQPLPAAGSQEYQGLQQQIVQYLVGRVQYTQKAEELGVTVTDEQVQERLDRMIKQFYSGSKKKYESELEKQGFTDEQWREQIRMTLIADGLAEKVGADVTVTDEEIEDYYKASAIQYTKQPSREVRHILVPSRKLADEIHAKIEAGESFDALAKKYSTDSSKDIGGKLTVSKGQTVPEFDKLAFSLKVNEVSKPVKTQFGWHIIEALGPASKGETTPLSEVKASIRERLLSQKKTDAFTAWLEQLKKEYADKIEYGEGFEPPPAPESTTSTS